MARTSTPTDHQAPQPRVVPSSARSRRRMIAAIARVLPLVSLLSLPGLVPAAARAGSGVAADRATVQQILDGPDLWIDQRRARVDDRAKAPEAIRTGNSRAQLSFRAGVAARMNRFSQMRLGSRCFLLDRGQMLLSGPQTVCTRSARLSVRGTHVLIELAGDGSATISVLEGWAELEPLAPGAAMITLRQGQRLRLSAGGAVLAQQQLSAADYRAFAEGSLVDGFTLPLPDQGSLEQAIAALVPGLGLRCAGRTEDSLPPAINGLRRQAGRADFRSLPDDLAERNCRYLAPVLRRILISGNCDHDPQRWEAFNRELGGRAGLTPISELIACPGPTPLQATSIVALWKTSPIHNALLLERPRASAISCVSMTLAGRTAAMCTTWGNAAQPRS